MNERHEIRVGTALMAPAFDIFMCYRNGDLIGFDADVAHHLVHKLSKKEESSLREPLGIRFRIFEWKDLFEAVQSGKVDFIIAGLSPTAKREEKYHLSFTYPYVENLHQVLIFQKQTNSENEEPHFDDNTTFVSARGTTQHDLAEFLSSALGGRVALVDTFADGVFALNGRQNYILVGDEGLNRSIEKQSGLTTFKIEKGKDSRLVKKIMAYQAVLEQGNQKDEIWKNTLSIAVEKNQSDLLEKLNEIIRDEHVHLKKLHKFWFSEDQGAPKCGTQQIDGFVYVEDHRLPQ
jgi:ABC-type amino acid transport substrate-binding protein